MKCLNFGRDSETIAQSILSDLALTGFYKQLTCAWSARVEVLGIEWDLELNWELNWDFQDPLP